MPLQSPAADLEALAMAMRISDAAWDQLRACKHRIVPGDEVAIRRTLIVRIMAAIREGERDPEYLQRLGLQAIERRLVPPL